MISKSSLRGALFSAAKSFIFPRCSPVYPAPESYDGDADQEAMMPLRPHSPEIYAPASHIPSLTIDTHKASVPMTSPSSLVNPQPRRAPSLPPSAGGRGVSLYDPGPGRLSFFDTLTREDRMEAEITIFDA